MQKCLGVLLFVLFVVNARGLQAQVAAAPSAEAIELGRRLFHEQEFSDPAANIFSACASCHKSKALGDGRPTFADITARNLVPTITGRPKAITLRNAPTLLDVKRMDRLDHDGRHTSLEQLIKRKLLGSMYGWSDESRDHAKAEIQFVLLISTKVDLGDSRTYLEHFREAYGLDLKVLSTEQVVDAAVRSIADFLRTLETTNTAPWDAFASMNRVPTGPIGDEAPAHHASRIFGRLANQEGRLQVKMVDGFDGLAYRGLKIFLRTGGEASVGNCVACHVLPTFTDFRFHNTGISQVAYDKVHGHGSFRRLQIPEFDEAPLPVTRPVARWLAVPIASERQQADLGYWNFVDAETSDQRRAGETADDFTRRMIGAFKTPTLRNLAQSPPYMSSGAYKTLEDAVAEIVRINSLARAGEMPNIDTAYLTMNLTAADVAPLVAFLNSLNEVPPEKFRDLLLSAQRHTGELSKPE